MTCSVPIFCYHDHDCALCASGMLVTDRFRHFGNFSFVSKNIVEVSPEGRMLYTKQCELNYLEIIVMDFRTIKFTKGVQV